MFEKVFKTMRIGAVLLLIPFLATGFLGCDESSNGPGQDETTVGTGQTGSGLTQDKSVSLTWPEAPLAARISYYNAIDRNASWIFPKDSSEVSAPTAVALNKDATLLYMSDSFGVKVIDTTNGEMKTFAQALDSTRGLSIADNGDVYIVDSISLSVHVYNAKNEFVRSFGEFENPQGVTVDNKTSRLYVADAAANEVSVWDLAGNHLSNLEISQENPMAFPLQIAVNSKGNIYVLNWSKEHVQVFTPDGQYIRGFGADGRYPSQFVRPKGLAIDSEDHIYVTDSAFGNFQIFDDQDRLLLWVGEGGNALGQFNLPSMLAIDNQDRIFVAEYGSNRVQIFQYLAN